MAVGVAGTKAVQAIKSAFTPEYLLQADAIEICDLTKPDKVTCFLVRCIAEDEMCSHTWDRAEWEEANPKVITVRSSLLVNVKHFCEKNIKACQSYVGEYNGAKIVLTED